MNARDIALLAAGAVCGAGMATGACFAVLGEPINAANVANERIATLEEDVISASARPNEAPQATTIPTKTAPSAASPAASGENLRVVQHDCDEACIAAFTESILTRDLTAEEAEEIGRVMPLVAKRIIGDPVLQRRYLNRLGNLRYDPEEAWPGSAWPAAMLYSIRKEDEFVKRAADRLAQSIEPEFRAMALELRYRADPNLALIERAIVREPDGPVLMEALMLAGETSGPWSPSMTAAIEETARSHRDMMVRQHAFWTLLESENLRSTDRDRLIDGALADPDPNMKLTALRAMSQDPERQLTEQDRTRYRAMATEIANDIDAAPEHRMQALNLLAYSLSAESAAGDVYIVH